MFYVLNNHYVSRIKSHVKKDILSHNTFIQVRGAMFTVSHLIFVFNLYEERESKADLRQLRDEDAVFRAVKSGRIIVLIDQQDGECGHDCSR